MRKLMFGYRGDGRNPETLKNDGGFVPKYLLERHQGGFHGFVQCANKTDGKMGCNCQGFGENRLYAKARAKLIEILSTNPMTLQQHVMFNNVGLLATAVDRSDMYGGHGYQVWAEFEFECTVANAEDALGIDVRRRNQIVDRFRILMNATRIANATLIAMVPHQSVELSFFSPVPFRYLKYLGIT